MATKYSAKHVYWNADTYNVVHPVDVEVWRCGGKLKLPERIIRFDSQLEFKVYLELCRMYTPMRVKRQVPLEIIPPCSCYPKGKTWKVDFAIANELAPEQYDYYVEAKGLFVPSFADTLACLEVNKPFEFIHLFVVFGMHIPKEKRAIKNLIKTDRQSNLLTLNKLRKLPQLL